MYKIVISKNRLNYRKNNIKQTLISCKFKIVNKNIKKLILKININFSKC